MNSTDHINQSSQMNSALVRAVASILALVLAFLVCGMLTEPAAFANSASDDFKKANKAQTKSLKKAARGKIKAQRSWYVNRSGKVQWGIVCGQGGPSPSGSVGTTFKRKSGRWIHSPPETSGGLQTLVSVCSPARTAPRTVTLETRKRCTNLVGGQDSFPNFTKRKNVSCSNARKIYKRSVNSLGKRYPKACKVGQNARWNGWTIRALGGFEATSFRKGSRSFLASGGGRC